MKSLGNKKKVNTMKGKNISISVACFSDSEYIKHQDFRLSARIQQSWSNRKHQLEHDYAIMGWVHSLLPEIREDIAERFDGNS